MKKIVSLMVASVFLFFSSQATFAEEPVVKMLDRYASWTASKTDTINTGESEAHGDSASTISFEENKGSGMGGHPGWDSFLEETKSYDYEKDHNKSA